MQTLAGQKSLVHVQITRTEINSQKAQYRTYRKLAESLLIEQKIQIAEETGQKYENIGNLQKIELIEILQSDKPLVGGPISFKNSFEFLRFRRIKLMARIQLLKEITEKEERHLYSFKEEYDTCIDLYVKAYTLEKYAEAYLMTRYYLPGDQIGPGQELNQFEKFFYDVINSTNQWLLKNAAINAVEKIRYPEPVIGFFESILKNGEPIEIKRSTVRAISSAGITTVMMDLGDKIVTVGDKLIELYRSIKEKEIKKLIFEELEHSRLKLNRREYPELHQRIDNFLINVGSQIKIAKNIKNSIRPPAVFRPDKLLTQKFSDEAV